METKAKEEKEAKKEMQAKINRDTGFLHTSTDKSKETSPDFFGTIDIDGVLYKMAGWKKTGEAEDANSFISLSLDMESWNEDTAKASHGEALDRFKADRKKAENKDEYLLIDWTGTIHKAKTDKPEDFFGTVQIGIGEDAELKYLKGFASTSKAGAPVIRLEVSDGTRTKEERAEIADQIL